MNTAVFATGIGLVVVLAILGRIADRRGRAGIAIALFVCTGVALSATPIGPPILQGTSTAITAIANGAMSVYSAVAGSI